MFTHSPCVKASNPTLFRYLIAPAALTFRGEVTFIADGFMRVLRSEPGELDRMMLSAQALPSKDALHQTTAEAILSCRW